MSNPHWTPTWLPADLELATTGHLALFLGGSEDSFTGDLLRLVGKAGPAERAKLMVAFPREVLAWNIWQGLENGGRPPTAGQLAALVDVDVDVVDRVLIGAGRAEVIAELDRLTAAASSPAANQVAQVARQATGEHREPGQGVAKPLQEP